MINIYSGKKIFFNNISHRLLIFVFLNSIIFLLIPLNFIFSKQSDHDANKTLKVKNFSTLNYIISIETDILENDFPIKKFSQKTDSLITEQNLIPLSIVRNINELGESEYPDFLLQIIIEKSKFDYFWQINFRQKVIYSDNNKKYVYSNKIIWQSEGNVNSPNFDTVISEVLTDLNDFLINYVSCNTQ